MKASEASLSTLRGELVSRDEEHQQQILDLLEKVSASEVLVKNSKEDLMRSEQNLNKSKEKLDSAEVKLKKSDITVAQLRDVQHVLEKKLESADREKLVAVQVSHVL